jgi:hypothetical protein
MPDNNDLSDILVYLAGGVGSGALLFILIQLAEKLYRKPLPANMAFYGAMFGAFAIPLVAYGLLVAGSFTHFSWVGLIGEFGVGYAVSQTIHWQAPADAISGIKPEEKVAP